MAVPKWLIIARNEYLISTSSIRKIRQIFPFLVIIFLGVYLGYIAPRIVDVLLDDFLLFFLSQTALTMIRLILFMFFLWFIIFPIANTLKFEHMDNKELLLSAPLKSSDLLMGKFLGQAPIYCIFITLITGFFTALLIPLGIDMLQVIIIVLAFVLILLSAEWIGILIASILRTRLEKSARGKDIGKALSMIIALPLIALMYAIIGGGLMDAVESSGTSTPVDNLLMMLPSTWGANIIMDFGLNPGDISSVWQDTIINFGGLAFFFIASLWIGSKLADRVYSLEAMGFSSSMVMRDGYFYKAIKKIGGGQSFGILLASAFKDYSRRYENLSKIIYIVSLMIMLKVFFGSDDAESPLDAVILLFFIFSLLAAFVVGEVTLRGKEALFIFKKAPSGEGKLIKTRLIMGLLIILPIGVLITLYSLIIIPQISIIMILGYTAVMIIVVMSNVASALGIAILNPVYNEKESMVNVMIMAMIVPQISLMSLIFLDDPWNIIIIIVTNCVLGALLLSLGTLKLKRME